MVLLLAVSNSFASGQNWILGQWKLVYDPDNSDTDYLHFHPNGDVVSTGPAGIVNGIYVVSQDRVKAVLTVDDKDLILTFFFNAEKNQLRIVTSETGRESIYQKVNNDE
jgi:hypothetical protein